MYKRQAKYSTKLIIKDLIAEFGPLEKELSMLNRGLHSVRNQVRRMRDSLLDIDETKEDFLELHQLLDRGEGFMTDALLLIEFISTNQDNDLVYWYEGNFKRFGEKTELVLTANVAPIDLAGDLSQNLFKSLDHCILTSATLRTETTFDYYLQRTGLNGVEFDDVKTAIFDSPFHFNDQVTYYQYSGSDGQRPVSYTHLTLPTIYSV